MADLAAMPVRPGQTAHHDLIELLISHHATIDGLFARLSAVGDDPRRRRDLIDVAIAELTRHAVMERECLLPAVRRRLDDGAHVAARMIAERRAAELLMYRIMIADVENPVSERLTRRLVREVRRQMRFEESVVFPRLRAECDPGALINLGTDVLSARKLAPTRPHPSWPSGRMADPLIGLVDQAIDALTDRPTTVEEL